jgi:tight adherence protein C
VRLVASVTDSGTGKPVPGLGAEDLVLTQGGAAQDAKVQFASQTAAVALAIVLDVSGSMAGRPLTDSKAAINSLAQALGPQDQAALLTFNATVRVAQPLTADKAAVVRATNAAVANGDTAIFDAVSSAIEALAGAGQSRRAIVLLTDGQDTASRSSRDDAVAKVSASGARLYVVGLGNDLDRPTLQALAGSSAGGQLYEAPTSAQLRAIYQGLAEQIKTEYAIEYQSTVAAPDGTEIPVLLQLRRGGTIVAESSLKLVIPAGRGTPVRTAAPVATQAPAPTAAPGPVVPIAAPDVLLSAEVVGLLGMASVLTLLVWIADLAARHPDRQQRRLEQFVRRLTLTAPEHSKRRSIIQRLIVPTLRTAGRPLLRITPLALIASTRQTLQHAGEPLSFGAVEFIGVRAGVGLAGGVIGLAATTSVSGQPFWVLLGGVVGAALGFVAPAFILAAFARSRQSAIRKSLPSALDMLALGAEAGLSFDGAVAQVAHRWNTPVSDEFRRMLLEFQMGRERRHSLRELGLRTGVPDLVRFANAVIQADSLGIPLSRVLREQAGEIRTRRRQRAEELARKAPVKMLFPMVLLIFPALFIVILGPAVPRLLGLFTLTH